MSPSLIANETLGESVLWGALDLGLRIALGLTELESPAMRSRSHTASQ